MKLVPREHWTIWSHWLISHGRARCTARNPDCTGCEMQDVCPTAFRHGPKEGGRRKAEGGRMKAKAEGRKMKDEG